MSLLANPLISESGVCSAEWTASKVVLGFNHGVLRVYSRQDFVLEREVRVGKGPVTALASILHTEIVAVVCDKLCNIHDLGSRKIVVPVDTSSAKYVTSLGRVLVVGSAYKLRILSFANNCCTSIAVVNTIDHQKVRAVGAVPQLNAPGDQASLEGTIFTVIGTKVPKLWRIDHQPVTRLVPIMVLDPLVFARAHKFVVTGLNSHVLVGSSVKSLSIRIDSMVTVVKNFGVVSGASLVLSQPEKVPLLVILNGETRVSLVNPFTATQLCESSLPELCALPANQSFRFVGPNLLASSAQLVEIAAELTSDMLTSSSAFPAEEAAELAFAWPITALTPEIRDLQRSEIAKLFNTARIDEAMQHLLVLEEQEPETGPFVVSEFASTLLLPYLETLPLDEPVSAAQSLTSTRTAATRDAAKVRYHPLNSVVKYLTYTRRKLKLRNVTNSASLRKIDTALFLSYLVMRSPLLASLLRAPNHCDLDVVVPRLREQGRWRELVAFLRSSGRHELALEVLTEYHESPEVLADYLVRVDDLDLVFKYASRFLPENPALVGPVFYDRDLTNGLGPRIHAFLTEHLNADVANQFALHAVQHQNDLSAELHDCVAQLLIEQGNADALYTFLRTSQHISLTKLVRRDEVPPLGRAILYERLQDYRPAIDLYLELDMPEVAQNLAVAHGEASYIFNQLVHRASPQNLINFLNTVSADADLQLDAVLRQLPSDFPIAQIAVFVTKFSAAVLMRTQRANEWESVSRPALAEASVALANEKRQRYTVGALDACAVCHKRLGRAITVITNGTAMHHACARNRLVTQPRQCAP